MSDMNMNLTSTTEPTATEQVAVTCTECGAVIERPSIVMHDDLGNAFCEDCFHKLFTICGECDSIVRHSDLVYVDGRGYCEDCFEELFTICTECGRAVKNDDITHIDGDAYCDDCFEELFTECTCCGARVQRDEAQYYDDDAYCDDCFEELFTTCYNCGDTVRRGDAFHDSDGDDYCERCFDDLFTTCDNCGCVVSRDDAVYIDDSEYCADCASGREAVHDYGYHPEPVFYEGGSFDPDGDLDLYMGVELEVDKGRNRNLLARELSGLTEMLYCKHDGSLSDGGNGGVEIVTHPCTLAAHRELFPWSEVLSLCGDHGFKSHDAGTCGLHIHVSRSAFRDSRDVFTAIALIDRLRSYIVRFSRRSVEKLNRWAEILDTSDMTPFPNYGVATSNIAEGSRYVAVNLQNRNTVEFRFPRGSLRYDTVIGTIELCRNIVLYARTHEPKDVANAVWEDLLNIGGDDGTNTELLRYWAGLNHDGLAPKELDEGWLVPIATPMVPVRVGDIVVANKNLRRMDVFNSCVEADGVFGVVIDMESRYNYNLVRAAWFDDDGSPLSFGHSCGGRLLSYVDAGWNVYDTGVTVVRPAADAELHELLDNLMSGGRDDVDDLIESRN